MIRGTLLGVKYMDKNKGGHGGCIVNMGSAGGAVSEKLRALFFFILFRRHFISSALFKVIYSVLQFFLPSQSSTGSARCPFDSDHCVCIDYKLDYNYIHHAA